MKSKKKPIIVSVILARGNSKAIPRKNIIDLNGKPLISYSISELHKSNVDEIWVSTDDEDIIKVSEQYGAKILRRPESLCREYSSSESGLLHFVNNVYKKFDILVFVQCTSPLIKFKYINQGIEMIKSGKYDSIFSCYIQHFLPEWSLNLKPLNWGSKLKYWLTGKPEQYPRRQDKETKLLDIGMFYVIKKEILLKNKFRL